MSPANPPLDAQNGASIKSDNITIPLDNISIGREEGNTHDRDTKDATRDLSTTGAKPLGTGEPLQSLPVNLNDIEDVEMRIVEVEEQFTQRTKLGLKESTRKEYLDRYREMSREMSLEKYTKRQLAGPQGKQLIIDYISTVPRSSVRTQLAAIKRVWFNGLGLP